MEKWRSPLGSTFMGFSTPKTKGSRGAGRLVSGMIPFDNSSGETSNSEDLPESSNDTAEATTGGCPSEAKSPKEPLYLPGGSAIDLSKTWSLRVPSATSTSVAGSQ